MSKQVNKTKRSFVVIDPGYHRLLKIMAAQEKTTLKSLVEGCLAELFAMDKPLKKGGSNE